VVGFPEQLLAWSQVCISFGVAAFSCGALAMAYVTRDSSYFLAMAIVKSLLSKKDGL
jgi:hypothetical protein